MATESLRADSDSVTLKEPQAVTLDPAQAVAVARIINVAFSAEAVLAALNCHGPMSRKPCPEGMPIGEQWWLDGL